MNNISQSPQISDFNFKQSMELSLDEVAIIQKRRDIQAQQDAAIEFQHNAIATAFEFDSWSSAQGEGLTFSTFISAFGYQGNDGKAMYEAVTRIYSAALPLGAIKITSSVDVQDGAIAKDSPYGPRHFLDWLAQGLVAGTLTTNTRDSFVHIVQDGVFLLSPAIFKHFLREHSLPEELHKELGRRLARLRCHIRHGDLNIHTYALNRPDRNVRLNGWVFPVSAFYGDMNSVPPINNHLIKL